MKSLRFVMALAAAALVSSFTFAAADSYDSETATVQKAGAHTAKVLVDKGTYKAPICFDDGASWDNVKDHYELEPAAVSGIKSGKMGIMVGADGTLSFKECKKSCSACTKK